MNVDDLFQELKELQIILPNELITTFENSNVCQSCKLLSKCFNCLSDTFNYTGNSCVYGKKFFKAKIVEDIFEFNNVTRKVK